MPPCRATVAIDPTTDIVLATAGDEVEDFTWQDAERLIRFGPGALADAPALLAERGFDGYVLLTTERARGQAPELLDGASAVLHVPGGLVPEAAAAVRDQVEGRPIVALGGGRVLDAAKAISAADGPPCAAVPTTLAGSPITRVHRLPEGVSGVDLVRPSLVVADPDLSASQPMPDLAASAMNALAHAVESLYAPRRSPVTEMAAMRAAASIAGGLGRVVRDRHRLALGAVLASWAVGATGYSVHHPVCQTLVAGVGTPHAATNAVLLPHSVRFAAPRAPGPVGRLALALGAERADPELAADLVAALAAHAGPTRLSELGVSCGDIGEVVEAVLGRAELDETPGGHPEERDLRKLLEAAL